LSIGYLITKNLDIRIEFKEHYYHVKSDSGLDELALFDSLGLRSDLPLNESTGLWLPGNRNQSFIDNTIEKAILSRLLYNADYVPSNRKARYRTRSVGLGLYYRFFPLGGEEGLMLEPSVRYWPNVWSDGSERYALENRFGQLGLHRAHDQGVFVNVSIGYYKQL
jgi:hypothetical protein